MDTDIKNNQTLREEIYNLRAKKDKIGEMCTITNCSIDEARKNINQLNKQINELNCLLDRMIEVNNLKLSGLVLIILVIINTTVLLSLNNTVISNFLLTETILLYFSAVTLNLLVNHVFFDRLKKFWINKYHGLNNVHEKINSLMKSKSFEELKLSSLNIEKDKLNDNYREIEKILNDKKQTFDILMHNPNVIEEKIVHSTDEIKHSKRRIRVFEEESLGD